MFEICVITTTRADFGLLTPLLNKILLSSSLKLRLIVSGTHLMNEYGNTIKEIENSGFSIDEIIDWEMHGDSSNDISKAMSVIINKFSDYVKIKKPDLAVILGDRFEMLAFAIVLVNANIPIAHINGGEKTEGALDECYRHCLTKMSSLHFPNCEIHKNRIIQMGEQPDRVFNVGDLCVENIKSMKFLSLKELRNQLDFKFEKGSTIVVTYHPVTTEGNSLYQLNELLKVIEKNQKFNYIITCSNADEGGKKINKRIRNFAVNKNNVRVFDSLGMKCFLSVLNNCSLIMGNSSSGIYEAPLFEIPTINIGNRQQGRLMPPSVINCDPTFTSISKALNYVFSKKFKQTDLVANFFGEGNASSEIVKYIELFLMEKRKQKKQFYDIFL
ncbi:MAG: UDP-N-acetylglucosamine 2-epimerase [Bacilli bacterium]